MSTYTPDGSVRPEEAPLKTIPTSLNCDTQTNGASRQIGHNARRGPLSDRLEGITGGHSYARTDSTGSSVESSGFSQMTPRPGGTNTLNVEARAQNRPAQPFTGPDDPLTQATRAIPVSKSYSRLRANIPGTTQRESTGIISRSTTSLLDEKNPPPIPVSSQNIQPVRTSRETGGDGSSSSSHPKAMETSNSSHAHNDPHREAHANSRMEDRGRSVQSLAGSSSSHLPWGAPSASSLSSSPPAAIKKTSSSMRQTKDTPPGEPERRLGSSANSGRSHVDLSTAVPERVAATALEPSPRQQSSVTPRIDRSTSRFQQPNQHDTVSSESFASSTASPIPSSFPGGVIRRSGSSHPRRGSDNDASRVDGSIPDTARPWGGSSPPPKASSPPRDQPSNKMDPSASAEIPFLSAPHDTLAKKKGETTDSASDGTTLKKAHSSSTTQGRSPKPTSQPTERHGDNLRDPPPQSHSLAVRQGQGDPSAKREQSSSTVISREMSQKPIDSRTRTKSPSDRKEHNHSSSSQSPSGQTHTHADSASYSDTQTKSRTEPHSESTRPEGAGGRQPGDGGWQGGGISRKTTEAIHPAPTKALSSLPDQLSSKASSGPASLLDSPAKKMPASSGDRTTRKEGMVSDSRSSVQVRTPEPPSSVAESADAHGANLNGLQTPASSFAVRQGQGDPVPKKEPSSILGFSREISQTPTESRTRTKSPPDRIDPSSSPSPSGQPHTHTNNTYSGAPTKSKVESAHSESMRPEGVGAGGQAGDGGQQGSGVSRKTNEALRPPPASSQPEKPSNKALEATGASSLPPTLLDSPAKKSLDMPASSTGRTTGKEVLNNNSSTQIRRLETISPAAESTEGLGVNVRDPPPPLLSSAVRRGEIDPVSKREASPSKGISREMSQTATDSRTSIKSPLDRIENIQPSSSPSLSKLPSTHHPPNNTAHSSTQTSRTEPNRLGSVRPDGAGDGGKARDGGQQGGAIPKTTADALTPPTKALSPPPEQPLNKPDANALPPTPLGSPLNKPLDMMSSSRKEASDSGLSMQDRRLQPTLPAAVPGQGHGVNLGEPLPPAPPPHSSGVRQGTGDPVAKKEPPSSMGTSREKSQTPMENRARTKSPQDRIEHTHSLSSPSLSRKPSTRPTPSTTADSSIPTSRSEPSHMESTRPEGSGRAGGGEQQRGGIPRGTTEVPPIGTDGPRTQAARAIPVSKSRSKLTPNVPGTESPGFISRSTTSLLDETNPPTVSPQNIQPVRISRKTGGDGSSSHPEAAEASRSGSSDANKDPHREVHAKSRVDDRGPSVQSFAGSSSSHLPWGGAPSTSSLPPSPPPAAIKKTSSSMGQTKDTPPGEPEKRHGSSANYGRSHVDLPTAVPERRERVAATAAEPAPHQQSSAPPRIDRSTSRFQQPNQHHTVSPEYGPTSGGVIRRTGSSHPRHGSDNNASRADGASVPDTARSWGSLPPPSSHTERYPQKESHFSPPPSTSATMKLIMQAANDPWSASPDQSNLHGQRSIAGNSSDLDDSRRWGGHRDPGGLPNGSPNDPLSSSSSGFARPPSPVHPARPPSPPRPVHPSSPPHPAHPPSLPPPPPPTDNGGSCCCILM